MATISPFVSGFSHTPAAHKITSVNAAISADQNHRGKPSSISEESAAKAAREATAHQTVQRQAAATSLPTTSYNAQGKVHAVEQAQTGRRFHAEA